MTENDEDHRARRGLIGLVMGKAKEFIGAVTGNDSLTAEGQVEQMQAREHKHAKTADAEQAEQAGAQTADAQRQSARERARDQQPDQNRGAERAAPMTHQSDTS